MNPAQLVTLAKAGTGVLAALSKKDDQVSVSGGRCGWLRVMERRTIQGKAEETVVGVCWAYLELGYLVR